ncbi:related to F-box protein pof7 [Sporisorium reilianum f. sp. reilianum]|uniref:Related to F-box protein pof7 n=1 Tax=Sporisorium reilianum f. sp. reilianum TaxID=72559 RepID=A0A2N8UJ64_9BASI|nr:related to F-box protein pof7 [Sporisorium reilianum f. sp. reilianum]
MDNLNTAPSIHSPADSHNDSIPSTPVADQSGTQTPLDAVAAAVQPGSAAQPVNDELERFRSEWKKEVQARGHPTYAQPPPSQPNHASTSSAPQASSSEPQRQDHGNNVRDDDGDGDKDELEDNLLHQDHSSLPFPEAEIYAPAALKYSKGAHKMPRNDASQSDLPAPIIPAEYHPPQSSAAPSTSSVANGVSHALRDRIRASAADSSTTRPPAVNQNALPISQAQASSSSRVPRIMATPSAPALASQATQAGMRSAVEAYAHAVEMERSGNLDQALASYRRAFKLNSNADRLYHRAHLLLTVPALANTSSQQNDALLSSLAIADKVRKALDFDNHRYVAIKERQAKENEARARGEPIDTIDPKTTLDSASAAAAAQAGDKSASKLYESRPDELAKLFDAMSIQGGGEKDFGLVAFAPEDEEKPMPVARLPDEILLHILKMLIAPRGRRGAKVVKPKPTPEEQAALDAATAALTGRAGVKPTLTKSDPQKGSKAGATAAAASANGGKAADANAASTASAKEVAPPAAAVEAPANGDKASDSSNVAIVNRKQPLGIGVVLGGADWQSLEILARTCWKFRLLTKSPSLWRDIVRETYYPPILDPALSLTSLYERHHSDWRTAFINQPRVRLNGCYIAACHYARPGLSEDAWVRVIHVVEFYRSIRFLPDGTALSLLTTDAPADTVRRLEPALKAKGFAKGRWELFEHGLDDDADEGRPSGPKVVVEDLRDKSMHKYAFRMVFGLRSTTRGRWNKLDLLEYYSVNLTNGEVLPLPQKYSRPFHFSRVIAYGV